MNLSKFKKQLRSMRADWITDKDQENVCLLHCKAVMPLWAMFGIANGYLETAAVAKDYPYGRERTEMFFFVEEKGKKGHRPVTQSRNPKNGQMNKPHAGTYRALPTYVVETKAGFFDFVSPPEYPDNGRAQEFIDKFWNQVPEKDQRYIKTWYKIMIARSPKSYENLVLNYPSPDHANSN